MTVDEGPVDPMEPTPHDFGAPEVDEYAEKAERSKDDERTAEVAEGQEEHGDDPE